MLALCGDFSHRTIYRSNARLGFFAADINASRRRGRFPGRPWKPAPAKPWEGRQGLEGKPGRRAKWPGGTGRADWGREGQGEQRGRPDPGDRPDPADRPGSETPGPPPARVLADPPTRRRSTFPDGRRPLRARRRPAAPRRAQPAWFALRRRPNAILLRSRQNRTRSATLGRLPREMSRSKADALARRKLRARRRRAALAVRRPKIRLPQRCADPPAKRRRRSL